MTQRLFLLLEEAREEAVARLTSGSTLKDKGYEINETSRWVGIISGLDTALSGPDELVESDEN